MNKQPEIIDTIMKLKANANMLDVPGVRNIAKKEMLRLIDVLKEQISADLEDDETENPR